MTQKPSYQLSDFSVSYSSSTCPYTNLAIEDHLIQGLFEGRSHFFVYRNDPSIVMGRFQVPWREVSMPQFRAMQSDLKLVRRRSGGGTVYHDLGNWNFCFIHKKRDLSRQENLALMIDLLASLGIKVSANERYDLVYHSDEGQVFKVSGSAFKQKKDTSLHHGTLLMNASLESLRGCLGHPQHWQLSGKGVTSVPSPVINLADVLSEKIEFSHWISAIEAFFTQPVQTWSEESLSEQIVRERNELSSWTWLWGETPSFTSEIPLKQNLVLVVESLKGQCVTAKIEDRDPSDELSRTLRSLMGCRLGAVLEQGHQANLESELEYYEPEVSEQITQTLTSFFF